MLKYDLGQGREQNWLIAETGFDIDHQGKCEAILCQGNGYLGQRAALEEPYVGQTRDLLVTGTFNRFDENEVCELPNLPDCTRMELTLNGHPFRMDRGETDGYLRVLNLHTGELLRTLQWTDVDGNRYALEFRRFVSLKDEHLIGQQVSITPLSGPCSVSMKAGFDGTVTCTGSQHFHEGDKRVVDGRILRMVSRTTQSDVACCQTASFAFRVNGEAVSPKLMPVIDRRYLGIRTAVNLEQGQTLVVERLNVITTSRDLAYEDRTDAAALSEQDGMTKLLTAEALGYDGAFRESAEVWAQYWDMQDVQVTSERAYDQLMLRFALYHLRIMCRRGDPRVGIGAKGLTGEGYKGHSFWDTEVFILPYFILTDPEAGRALVEFRYRGLLGARKKAAENGFEGAMYPWEAAWVSDGEVTPLWGSADIVTGKPIPILTGLIEQHITADVAFGVHLYEAVTHDQGFMDRCGYEILIDTARFWASRVTWDADRQRYVILDVIGPDEYKEHVNNNAYTNYMAAMNLRLGLAAMDTLESRADDVYTRLNEQFDFAKCREAFEKVLDGLYLPEPNSDGIIPQFDGYFDLREIDLAPYKNAGKVGTIYDDYNPEQMNRIQVHKQADTLVLLLLMDDLFPHDIKVRNFDFYESRTLHDSSLSKSTHCVLAADLGQRDMAYSFFEGCGEIDLGPNMGTSDMGVHTASMGGIWQCAVYGFGGARVVGDELHIAPDLPEAWTELVFPLTWRGQRLKVHVTKDLVTVQNEGTETVTLRLCGQSAAVAGGETIETTR